MAITSAEIQSQGFPIDRKGYAIAQVDAFLDYMAREIDALNNQVIQLGDKAAQADNQVARLEASNAPLKRQVAQLEAEKQANLKRIAELEANAANAVSQAPVVDTAGLAERDETIAELKEKVAELDGLRQHHEAVIASNREEIAELERKLEDAVVDDSAIGKALITAHKAADEVTAEAQEKAAATIKAAEVEAKRILDEAEVGRQKVAEAIGELEDERESVRAGYKQLLADFINDAMRKFDQIGEVNEPCSGTPAAEGTAGEQPVSIAGEASAGESDEGSPVRAVVAAEVPATATGCEAADAAGGAAAGVPGVAQ